MSYKSRTENRPELRALNNTKKGCRQTCYGELHTARFMKVNKILAIHDRFIKSMSIL